MVCANGYPWAKTIRTASGRCRHFPCPTRYGHHAGIKPWKISWRTGLIYMLFATIGIATGGACLAEAQDKMECVIVIGGEGESHRYGDHLNLGESLRFDNVPISDFIRSTSGPCTFTVYNSAGFGGRWVTLGSDLTERIRAGLDGVSRRKGGGGDTWRIRSLMIQRVNTTCRLRIGGGGVRMTYFPGNYPQVPAMDRIGEFLGGDCTADIWSDVNFGDSDTYNRFKSLNTSGPRQQAYDPGYRVRSMKIMDGRSICPDFTRDTGRCLPQTLLDRSLYVNSAQADQDTDGLDDELENQLATAFRPIYVNHSTEDATRTGIYRTSSDQSVIEPATLFQVSPQGDSEISIRFMKLWRYDIYNTLGCGGHEGDSQPHQLYLKTTPPEHSLHGRLWYVYRVLGGVEGDLNWTAGNGALRGPRFQRWPGEPDKAGIASHLVIYFSKGKHHEYVDGGWSGQTDKECWNITAYTDGRGHLHRPPLPKRLAIIHAPSGRGDRFGFTNVGTVQYPFFDDLGPYGFSGQRVWSGKTFYSNNAQPVCRVFSCCEFIECEQTK